MQITKQPTGLRTAAKNYQTIVQQASGKVAGFQQLYKDLQRGINVSGKSTSTLTNYRRHLAHLAVHYQQILNARFHTILAISRQAIRFSLKSRS